VSVELSQAYRDYWTDEMLTCSVCKKKNLDEYLCFNCKQLRECTDCCGCYELEEGEE
jgi:hypothetical protein